MNKELLQLLKKIEVQIVSILLVKGYVSLLDNKSPLKFNNIRITPDGKEAIKKDRLVSDEQILEYMNLWPKGYKSTLSSVKAKMERFLINNKCTIEEINAAAIQWLKDKATPYHGRADYFFYKMEGGIEISRCEEYINYVKDLTNNEEEDDFRKRVT